jgi:deoxyribodipyrimidine photo-lyase
VLYHASPEQVVKAVHEQQHIQAVFINSDYTPFSRRRDNEIHNVCKHLGIIFHYLSDILLTESEQVVKSDHMPYKVFTAFYNNARQVTVALPQALLVKRNFVSVVSGFRAEQLDLSFEESSKDSIPGGCNHALAILNQLTDHADYQNTRDFPALDTTSKRSAHLKFGARSICEVYYAITAPVGSAHPLLRQLYWRDFFTHIAYHFPPVFGRAFLEKFTEVPLATKMILRMHQRSRTRSLARTNR